MSIEKPSRGPDAEGDRRSVFGWMHQDRLPSWLYQLLGAVIAGFCASHFLEGDYVAAGFSGLIAAMQFRAAERRSKGQPVSLWDHGK